jgi:signal transduction histidine kinase
MIAKNDPTPVQGYPAEPRRVLRWVYTGRFCVTTAIFLTAVRLWGSAQGSDTLLASLTFIAMLVFTGGSLLYTEVYGGKPTPGFLHLQVLFDLFLVTAVVHVTGGAASQFAALYILVIASTALLLPPQTVVLVAGVGNLMYMGDALLAHPEQVSISLWLQLLVFATVALGSAYVSARLREANAGHDALVAELAEFRLRAPDIERLHLRAGRLEAVAELSASLAHEIKNPLASIRSAVEQLTQMPRSTPDERVLGELVERESDRLSRLLSEFIDFARVGVTAMERLDVAAITVNAVRVAEAHPDCSKGVRIVSSVPKHTLYVDGDTDLLYRAIFNVVLNAIQASPAGGEVRVDLAELGPHQLPPTAYAVTGGAVAIRVSDHGPGIPKSARERLFLPFFTTKQGGSGLGLAIVHRAIEAHGGVVVVDDAHRSSGAQFTIVLPKSGTLDRARNFGPLRPTPATPFLVR